MASRRSKNAKGSPWIRQFGLSSDKYFVEWRVEKRICSGERKRKKKGEDGKIYILMANPIVRDERERWIVLLKLPRFFLFCPLSFFLPFFLFFFFFNRSIVSRRFETHQRYINLNRKIHLYPCNYLQLASKSVICSFARIDECSYTQQ